jgi:protein-tyrosine phosphatase
MKVCFVCTGNYYRSRFAEATFNFMAKECGEKYVAESRGLNISAADKVAADYGELSPYTKNKMEELDIPISFTSSKRQPISKQDLKDFDIIVVMDRSEHFSMVKSFVGEDEDMILSAKNFKYWAIKDVFDWKPEETLGAILANVNKFFNEIRWGLV